jgi:UDP-3-O-[3-hydroxymyristoyl] glucosamine N-acyltransferase
MADPRFFRRAPPIALGDIARFVGGELSLPDSAGFMIQDIAALEYAGEGDITVLSDRRYLSVLGDNAASAVLTTPSLGRFIPTDRRMVFIDQPRLAFARLGHLFYREPVAESPGIDPSARIAADATIGSASQIEAGVVIGAGAVIGRGCQIGANAVIGAGVVLGEDCRIGPNTTISHALIGDRAEIGSGASIGGPGFGFEPHERGLVRMLQVGRVIIEDDVDIGANAAIDRGATGDTVIGAGSKLDNLVQIGHNVRMGKFCIVCGQAGIAGSTVLGDGVIIGGGSSVSDHLTIGSGARIAGKSGVMRSIEPGGVVAGYPAVPVGDWHRQTAGLIRLFSRRSKKPGTEPPE